MILRVALWGEGTKMPQGSPVLWTPPESIEERELWKQRGLDPNHGDLTSCSTGTTSEHPSEHPAKKGH